MELSLQLKNSTRAQKGKNNQETNLFCAHFSFLDRLEQPTLVAAQHIQGLHYSYSI